MLKKLYNTSNNSKNGVTGLKKMFFDLDDSKPVKVLCNEHLDQDDSWFDMHYEVEVGIVLRGKMCRKYLNFETELSPGDIWINGVWELHGFDLPETPCEVVVFIVDPEFLLKKNPMNLDLFLIFKAAPENRPAVCEGKKAEICELGIRTKSKILEETGSAWAQLLFLELMLSLSEGWASPKNSETTYTLPQSIQPALKLIFEKKKLISTKEATSECRMAVSTFRNKFKEFMGVSFSEFALEIRVKGARAELQKSNETRQNIAQKWGFTDASHLQRYLRN